MTEVLHSPDACRLGKLDPKPPRVMFRDYVDIERLKAYGQLPTTINNSLSQSIALGMYLNDSQGDCTCAAAGNILRVVSRGKAVISDHDVENGYVYVTGKEGAAFDPSTGANDNGAVPLDVLDYWTEPGFGPVKILGHAGIDMTNDAEKRIGLQTFGSIYMGIQLAIEQQKQQVWDWVSTSSPGSWGGHLFPLFDLVLVNGQPQWVGGTWAQYKWATDAFVTKQADEGHVVVTRQWAESNASNPLFDVAALVHDLKQYKSES